jgi:antitoxin component of MazEF toxin-antitoxin module
MLIKKLGRYGSSHTPILPLSKTLLRLLNWSDDQMVEITLTADGKGILVTKVESDGRELTKDEIAAIMKEPTP